MISIENTTIDDQPHQMVAEGSEDSKIDESEVYMFMDAQGWHVQSIEINFDTLQSVWRWTCKLHTKNSLTLLQLKEKIDYLLKHNPRHANWQVKILDNSPSMGARSSTAIDNLDPGFDWESGIIHLKTRVPLYKHKKAK